LGSRWFNGLLAYALPTLVALSLIIMVSFRVIFTDKIFGVIVSAYCCYELSTAEEDFSQYFDAILKAHAAMAFFFTLVKATEATTKHETGLRAESTAVLSFIKYALLVSQGNVQRQGNIISYG